MGHEVITGGLGRFVALVASRAWAFRRRGILTRSRVWRSMSIYYMTAALGDIDAPTKTESIVREGSGRDKC